MDDNNNSGYRNSGNFNSGYRNSGDNNSGNSNSGDRNSGNFNSGYRNSGDNNSGHFNSGFHNSGYNNSGNRNSGNYNSGNFNSGDNNFGYFNRDEPKMRMFEKESSFTYQEYINSGLYINFDIKLTEWIYKNKMSTQEKNDNTDYDIKGGYLKTYSYKEAWNNWWKINKSDEMIERIKKLPNFNSTIFKDITGIDIEAEEVECVTIEVNGKKTVISKDSAKALNLI